MTPKALLQASYLDIVFDNRNKQYGAYELRTNYQNRTLRAMLFILIASIAFCACSYFISHLKANLPAPGAILKPTILVDITPPILPPSTPPPPPAHQLPKQQIKTQAFTPPRIVTDAPDIPTPSIPKGAESGIKTTTEETTGSTPGPGTISDPGNYKIEVPVKEIPVKWVPQMPEFNGNLLNYLNAHLHYPEMARNRNISGRVVVQFIVNEDGKISNAEVLKGIGGGCDEEALNVVKSMPPWKPGKQNGKAVKVYFTLPVVFLLQ